MTASYLKWQRKRRRAASRKGMCRSCRGKRKPRTGLRTCDHCLELAHNRHERAKNPLAVAFCSVCLASGTHRPGCSVIAKLTRRAA